MPDFFTACLEGFDEDASAEELKAHAKRFQRIRACFLAGDPLLDSEAELQKTVLAYYKEARTKNDSLIREVDRGLSLLVEFCRAKQRATYFRLKGHIVRAKLLEDVAESRYQQLPDGFRW